jgi:hypothetical protein
MSEKRNLEEFALQEPRKIFVNMILIRARRRIK